MKRIGSLVAESIEKRDKAKSVLFEPVSLTSSMVKVSELKTFSPLSKTSKERPAGPAQETAEQSIRLSSQERQKSTKINSEKGFLRDIGLFFDEMKFFQSVA